MALPPPVERCLLLSMSPHEHDSQRQVKKLRKTQRTIESNMSNLYDVAKGKIAERGQMLTAARLQANGVPAEHAELPEKRQRT